MLDSETGHRYQESLRENPGVTPVRTFAYPLRGSITKVSFMDDQNNKTGQTLVDINLHGGRSYLIGVPISVSKANATTGEEWTPEPGDLVVVQFLNGQWNDPVVTGFMNMPSNKVQAKKADVPAGKRRYHLRCNKTDVVIDKDGNRITTVEKDDTLTIKGNGTINVGGNITIQVTGNANISVTGNTTVTTPEATVIASTKVTLTTPLVAISGNLTVGGNVTVTGDVAAADVTVGGILKTASISAAAGLNITSPGAVSITGITVGVIETGA